MTTIRTEEEREWRFQNKDSQWKKDTEKVEEVGVKDTSGGSWP